MADFHWNTEDENDWPVEPEEVEGNNLNRGSWQFPVIIIIVLGLTVAGLYSLFNRRAEEAEQLIKGDVRRTHGLVLEAADSGDDELFTTFLSGASARWLELQQQSVRQNEFDQTPWLGFELDDRPYRIDDITLTPTLDEATITYTRWYLSGEQDGGAFPLQHTVIYRRGEDRWLLAPPTADFWGREAAIEEKQLTILYPERDEEQAQRLAQDLLASLPEICVDLPGGDCPENWEVTVTLSSDMEHKLTPTRIEGAIDDLSLDLPTPSLLGLPLDDAGYEAILQSYQARLHREVVASLTQYLADRPELVPPVVDADRLAKLPSDEMTFSCSTGGVGRFEWNTFRYSLVTGEWTVPFTKEYQGEDSGFVIPLPDGNSYMIQEYLRDDLLTARLLVWQDGETVLITEQTVNFDNALSAPFYPREIDPTSRYIVLTTVDDNEDTWNLVDREMCSEESGCQFQSIYNLPYWSPNGSQMLMTEGSYVYEIYEPVYRTLYRADGNGQNPVAVGEGIAPFWLNETTYGYSRLNENEEVELVLADSADDEARVWVNTADLIPLVPAERNWSRMSIWNVWPNPADPEMVVIMVTPGGYQSDGPYDFFMIKGTGDSPKIEWLFSNDFPASTGVSPFSPDGRYLLVPQRGTAIHFRDLETGEIIPFDNSFGFFAGWTPDGSYYGQLSEDGLTLTSPENGSQIRVIYNFSTCSGIQWIEN